MIKEPVIVLANGKYPKHPLPLKKLISAGCIICCDGAVNKLDKKGFSPTIIIGDLDSIDKALLSKYKNKIFTNKNQDENDLRKALKWAEQNGIKKLTILGATGKREDHTLANIFTLMQYPSKIIYSIITDHGIFKVISDSEEIKSFNGQQISIFSNDPTIKITSTNLKYNLKKKSLKTMYSGTLNQSCSKKFTLTLSHGKILIYLAF